MQRRKADDQVRRVGLLAHAVGGCCALATAVAVWAVVCVPLQSGNASTRQKLREAFKLVHDSREIRGNFAKTRAEYEATSQALNELRRRIPATSAESEFLSEVASSAGALGLSIAEFHPGRVEEGELCRQMEVRLRGKGEFASLCQFLAGLKGLDRLSRIKHVKIAVDASGEGLYSLDLTLAIYFGLKSGKDQDSRPETPR